MNTCKIQFPAFDARTERNLIRWELFLHKEVRDLLLTPQADTLCIVHRGDPNPAGWAATLTAAGYPEPLIGPSTASTPDGTPKIAA